MLTVFVHLLNNIIVILSRRIDCLVHSSESEKFSVYLPMNVRTNASLTNAKHEIVFRMRQIKQGRNVIFLYTYTF